MKGKGGWKDGRIDGRTLMSRWQTRLAWRYCRPETRPKKSLAARGSGSTPPVRGHVKRLVSLSYFRGGPSSRYCLCGWVVGSVNTCTQKRNMYFVACARTSMTMKIVSSLGSEMTSKSSTTFR